MLKKIAEKLEVRVWGLPTLVFYLLMMVLFFSFTITAPDRGQGYILEPESGREVAFEIIIGVLFVIYLWVLVYRFSTKGKRPLSWLAKGGVILLTALFIIGIFCQLFLYLRK